MTLVFRGEPAARPNGHGLQVPVQHVYYLKTHKTGSTTMYSILAEFCRSHQLLALLPSGTHINLRPPFHPSQVVLHDNISKYDMVFNHHVYDEKIFKYLHNDTFKFTTLREPFRHFISSFTYFREVDQFPYLKRINTSDPLASFLADPQKYETKRYASFTNNRQSMDLGFNLSHPFHDLTYIRSFISQTEKRFHLVLITDYFHESLILLKRTLHWTTADILYYKKLASGQKLSVSNETLQLYRQQHKQISTADSQLYHHFLLVFKEKISAERGLFGEVKEFETLLKKVHSFCDKTQLKDKQLVIPPGKWTDEINILHSKCKWLRLGEVSFTKYLQTVRNVMFGTPQKTDSVQMSKNTTQIPVPSTT
ncbi:unnamed protein product [Candidula unifasciata]|uniref:Uncharacterized protein n=1 Tax=Candidula unifasciata TaxID=100452 RepID=A0A8S3ZTZ8_9EUPU|nr:unnamed protein product [Candidula unifasciata]